MKQEGLKFFADIEITTIGLALFVLAFIMIVVKVFILTDKKQIQHWANLPLDTTGDQAHE